MRFVYSAFIGTVLGSIAGLISALYLTGVTSTGMHRGDTVSLNGWVSDWSVGSPASGRYVKAWVARYGLLAMQKSEAVYFIRAADDDGQPLRESCRYLVSGGALPGEWWSITLYDRLKYLPMNEDDHLSVDASRMSGSRWQFEVAPARPSGEVAWISSKAGETFDLTLRVYRPDAAFLEAPGSVGGFPSIRRLSCDAEAAT